MCTFAINENLNGIEITFESKPSNEIRDSLKALGFRWHGQKKLWYAKKSDERMALAQLRRLRHRSPPRLQVLQKINTA